MALARQLKRSWSRTRPHILLWLLYGPHHLKTPDDAASTGLDGEARAAFAELAAAAGNVGAYCETPAMADFYRSLVPFEVGVMPGPGLPARARATRAAAGRRSSPASASPIGPRAIACCRRPCGMSSTVIATSGS